MYTIYEFIDDNTEKTIYPSLITATAALGLKVSQHLDSKVYVAKLTNSDGCVIALYDYLKDFQNDN